MAYLKDRISFRIIYLCRITFGKPVQSGTQFRYSNFNYLLLGYIIEKVTGDSYESQLRKRIIDRLGLKATCYGHPADRKNFARSYAHNGKEWIATPTDWNTSWIGGAGAITATPMVTP